MKLFEELRVYKFWAGIWPDVNNNFSSAGKTLENLTAELLTHTVLRRRIFKMIFPEMTSHVERRESEIFVSLRAAWCNYALMTLVLSP